MTETGGHTFGQYLCLMYGQIDGVVSSQVVTQDNDIQTNYDTVGNLHSNLRNSRELSALACRTVHIKLQP